MSYFGSLTFTIPTYNTSGVTTGTTTISQYYDNDLDYSTSGYTATPTGTTNNVVFMAVGSSRVSELKKYGTNSYNGITAYTENSVTVTGYTIGGLNYVDYPDGYTKITGKVPNYFADLPAGYSPTNTTEFVTEYVINKMLTRNEHFLGFAEEPTVYSDVFVDRGKQGVMEMNLRLGEVDNLGSLSNYGNGFFNVKKQ